MRRMDSDGDCSGRILQIHVDGFYVMTHLGIIARKHRHCGRIGLVYGRCFLYISTHSHRIITTPSFISFLAAFFAENFYVFNIEPLALN